MQLLRVVPYSAVQLGSYEIFKRLLRDEDGNLPVVRRLIAGAAAGMCSTFVSRRISVRMTERKICAHRRRTRWTRSGFDWRWIRR